MSFCSILSIIMVTNKYFPKLQPKLQTCSRSVQEIHLGHLAGLDAVDDVDVGLHRLVDVLGKDTVVLHPVPTSCRNPLNEIRSLRRLIAYFCNSLSFDLPIKQPGVMQKYLMLCSEIGRNPMRWSMHRWSANEGNLPSETIASTTIVIGICTISCRYRQEMLYLYIR